LENNIQSGNNNNGETMKTRKGFGRGKSGGGHGKEHGGRGGDDKRPHGKSGHGGNPDPHRHFLQVENLTVEYTSGGSVIHAVNGLSFSMQQGSTLGLVGETGAGKTTIAKSIIRVLPKAQARIKSGEIILEGEDLLELSDHDMEAIRGNKISMIFQDPMTALNPTMTVGEQIAEAIRQHKKGSKQDARKQAADVLKQVGIMENRYDDFPFQFSGGMRQRVVIAMALACEPKLLLADEPTTALDVTIQAQMLELIANLKEKYKTSMILITHDLGVVAENCDDVAVVYAGKIVECGKRADIFLKPAHPYTIGLFQSLPSFSKNAKRLKQIPGTLPNPANLPEGCAFNPRCQYARDDCRSGEIPRNEISHGHFCLCRYPREGGTGDNE